MTRKHVKDCPIVMQDFAPLKEAQLEEILGRIRDARVVVLGDYCLDVYWFVDSSRREPSLETGLLTWPVREHKYSLGGAGNVVNNVVALGCRQVYAVGVVGDDPWGRELVHLLRDLDVNADDVLVQDRQWSTLAYTKPHIDKEEGSRFDFGNFNALSRATAEALLDRLRGSVAEADVVIVNQQVQEGVHSPAFREGLMRVMKDFPDKIFVIDSRHYSEFYKGGWLKINDHEAARLCAIAREPGDLVLREEALRSAAELYRRFGKPIVVTRGARGMLVHDEQGVCEIPGIQVMGPVDTVGAGDSALAGFGCALAVGCDAPTAGMVGNMAAVVTIQKLKQTGTACPEEVMAVGRGQNYIYRPELAEDPRPAQLLEGTEFEVVNALPSGLTLKHAIFDHDGTISTLREGWEKVMEPMMVRAALGAQYDSADESLYHRVVDRVRDYIDKSTGVQTLVQMQGLVGMVRELGCVPETEILNEFGYKKVYNDALMQMVRIRLAKLERKELAVDDFVIKNAVTFLKRLRTAGVRMVLASGTDQEDVEAEARGLGYADLFDGGIYGSVGDVTRDAKKMVLDRILGDIGESAVREVVTFGDGPVEIRETHSRGGVAVGVATDEIRRFGLNPAKRSRLIRAGADLVVPDFSQMEALLKLLGVSG